MQANTTTLQQLFTETCKLNTQIESAMLLLRFNNAKCKTVLQMLQEPAPPQEDVPKIEKKTSTKNNNEIKSLESILAQARKIRGYTAPTTTSEKPQQQEATPVPRKLSFYEQVQVDEPKIRQLFATFYAELGKTKQKEQHALFTCLTQHAGQQQQHDDAENQFDTDAYERKVLKFVTTPRQKPITQAYQNVPWASLGRWLPPKICKETFDMLYPKHCKVDSQTGHAILTFGNAQEMQTLVTLRHDLQLLLLQEYRTRQLLEYLSASNKLEQTTLVSALEWKFLHSMLVHHGRHFATFKCKT